MGQQQQTVTAVAGGALKRMSMVLALALVMAAMAVIMAAPAFAAGKHLEKGQIDNNGGFNTNDKGDFKNDSNPGNGVAFHNGDDRN